MTTGQPLTDADLAAVLRVDLKRVAQLAAEGMPRRRDGRFDLAKVAEWIEGRGLGRRCNWGGIVKTLGDVAAAFGVGRDTVRRDWRSRGMPGKSGHWDLSEIAEWRAALGRAPEAAALGSAASADAARRRAADARYKEGQARRIERQNRLAEEEICYRADVERFLAQLFEFTRELHGRLAAEIRPQLPKRYADQITADLAARLEGIQRTLHAWARRLDEIAEDEK